MWHDKGGCGSHGAGRRGWGLGEEFSGMFWGGGGRRRGGPFRGGRMFGQGDLKYVILQLLAEKPRHGYEIIKELEERFAGSYAPSAGTVYPTLSLLEDIGYASVALEDGGKKVYSITDTGRQYLEQNQGAVDDIFERIAEFGASFLSEGMRDINRAMGTVGRATYASSASYFRDAEKVRQVREALERAAKEIDGILGRTAV
ncbi:MAG: PadR family transcriptional regulator [Gemmatimonadota bacterium]